MLESHGYHIAAYDVEGEEVIYPDADPENADWLKGMFWDLPPYKGEEFLATLEATGFSLAQFRELSVYKGAVARGLIVGDEWAGNPEGYE